MIITTIIFGVLGSLAGGSFPYSYLLNKKGEAYPNGQDKRGIMPINLTFLPELLLAVFIGSVAVELYEAVLGVFSHWVYFALLACTSFVSLMGINAATYGMLYWQNGGEAPDREATIKPIVDFFAGKFGYKYGDEGYAWIWAAVKGFITTLPLGGFGAILFPLGYEAGSHAEGRIKGDTNIYREFLSYAAIGLLVGLIKLL